MTQPWPNPLLPRLEIVLRPDAKRDSIQTFCAEASQRSVSGVCVCSSRVELVRTLLDGSEAKVIGLLDHPWGAADSDAKRFEAEVAVDLGAQEVQYVVHAPRLQDGEFSYLLREMRDIVEAADERPVTMVLESHLLSPDQVQKVCEMALDAGIQGVSTGLSSRPAADPSFVRGLRGLLGSKLRIKAAGRIYSVSEAQPFFDAGADRFQVEEEVFRLVSTAGEGVPANGQTGRAAGEQPGGT